MSSNNNKKGCWTDLAVAIVGGLVVAVIVAVVPAVRDWVIGLFKYIGSFFVLVWNYLLSSIEIPWYLVWLLVFLAVPTVWKLARPLVNKIRKKPAEQKEPNLEEYAEDSFEGVIWRWNYIQGGFPDEALSCFCPDCNTRLIAKRHEAGIGRTIAAFFCETCNKQKTVIEGGKKSVLDKISRQIERRVNTGEWKGVVMSLRNKKQETYR